MRKVLLSLPLLFAAQIAHADEGGSCGCNGLIPAQGVYDSPAGPLVVSYLDGDAETCPTSIRAEFKNAPPSGVAIAGADLTCSGGAFVGPDVRSYTDEKGVTGKSTWVLQAVHTHVSPNVDYSGGLSISEQLDITISPPPNMQGPRAVVRSLTATAGQETTAAPCVCEKVAREIEFEAQQLRVLEDVEFAQALKDAGNTVNPRFTCMGSDLIIDGGKVTGDGNIIGPRPPKFGNCLAKVELASFHESVSEQVNANRSADTGRPASSHAAARTSMRTCEVHPPELTDACTTQVFYDAAYLHEMRHKEQCEALNASDIRKESADFLLNQLRKHPKWQSEEWQSEVSEWSTAYIFSNNPVNAAQMEADAYRVSFDHLVTYYQAKCGGVLPIERP